MPVVICAPAVTELVAAQRTRAKIWMLGAVIYKTSAAPALVTLGETLVKEKNVFVLPKAIWTMLVTSVVFASGP